MMQSDASFSDRLSATAAALAQRDPAYARLVEAFVARLAAACAGDAAPAPGQPMPDFLLPDAAGRLVRLADLTGRGPVALTFLRGHWCPFCRAQAEALALAEAEITALGGQVALITPERAAHAADLTCGRRALVLCDMDNAYALELGLAVAIDPAMADHLRAGGDDLAAFQAGAGWVVPVPATFVLDAAGVVCSRMIDCDYRRRPGPDQLIAAMRAAMRAAGR